VNLILSAEWRAVQAVMLTALEPHLEARIAVAHALAQLGLTADLRCGLDPVCFAVERLAVERLGFTPDPWQGSLLRSASQRLLLNCSRQAGKSTTTAIVALHTALFRPNSLTLLVSPSLRQSRELFAKVVAFLKRLEARADLDEDNRLSFRGGDRSGALEED
jgi:hypothetical protein